MHRKLIIFFQFLFVYVTISWASEPCQIHLSDPVNSPLFKPLILSEDGNLYPAQNEYIKLNHGKKVIFSCQNNYFRRFSKVHEVKITCDDDKLMIEDDKDAHQFKDFSCDLKVIQELKNTVENCPSKYQGVIYAYYDNKLQKTIKLAEACYDMDQMRVRFIHAVLPKVFPSSEMQISQHMDSFEEVPTSLKLDIIKSYRTDTVMKKLHDVLGDDFNFASNTIIDVKLLPKSFYNEQMRDIHRFPTNSMGLWSSVAWGNWKNLMIDIKELSNKMDLDLTLRAVGVLKINGRELFLGNNKVPLPQYTYAVVNQKIKKDSVAIVTINNPFITSTELKEAVFCKNICDQITWLTKLTNHKNYDKPAYGYTFCCSIEEFSANKML